MPPICTFNAIRLHNQKSKLLHLVNATRAELLAHPDTILIECGTTHFREDNPGGLFLSLDGFIRLGDSGFTSVSDTDTDIPAYNKAEAKRKFTHMATHEIGVIYISPNLGTPEQRVFATAGTLDELNTMENAVVSVETMLSHDEQDGDIFILPDNSFGRYFENEYIVHTPPFDTTRVETFRQRFATAS